MNFLSWLADIFPESPPPHVHKPGTILGRSTSYGMDVGGRYYTVVHYVCSECAEEFLRRIYEQ